MKALIATDSSVHACTAMLTACRLLRTDKIEVDFATVSPRFPRRPSHPTGTHERYEQHFTRRARKIVDDAQRLVARTFSKTRGLIESGSPADKLLAMAPDYDLTVLGAYGRHERKQPGLGPVTSRLLQMSRGNVLIGRELVNENNYRVLVALDSSEASLVALQTSVALFDTSSFDITLLHVVESPWAAFASGQSQDEDVDFSEIDEYQRQLGNELRQTADTVLESAMRHLERFAIPVTSLIKEGDPALEICSEAEQGGYDLVVAGATGVSDVKHALLGSVSLKVAWDCPCSVAIIRQGVR